MEKIEVSIILTGIITTASTIIAGISSFLIMFTNLLDGCDIIVIVCWMITMCGICVMMTISMLVRSGIISLENTKCQEQS